MTVFWDIGIKFDIKLAYEIGDIFSKQFNVSPDLKLL